MQDMSWVGWHFWWQKTICRIWIFYYCVIYKCEVCDVIGLSARNTCLFKSFTIKTWSLLHFVLKSWCWFWFWFWIWGCRCPTPTLVKDSIPVEVFHQIPRKMWLKRGWDVFSSKIERKSHHDILQEMNKIWSYENSDLTSVGWPQMSIGEKWKMAPCFCWL